MVSAVQFSCGDYNMNMLPTLEGGELAHMERAAAYAEARRIEAKFSRYRDDLLYELPVNFAQAALGTEVEVPTLDGNTKLKIPAGSQTGEVFKLRGKGVVHLRGGGHGDLLVTLFVATPDSLNACRSA